MVSIINVFNNFIKFVNQYEDPRTAKWFLISNPIYPVAICLTYIYVVKVLGPHFMANREPFKLKRVLMMYNLFQIIFNGWMFYEFSVTGWLTKEWSYVCQPMDYSDNPRAVRMAKACWWFYMSKYVDFLDTVFFILRKKNSQVTKLHIIHHGMVPLSIWVGAKYVPGGHGTICCFLNTFVHVVMYTYYFLSSLGPKIQKYLWWKKYITTIQMMQFVVILVHTLLLWIVDCDFPRKPMIVVMLNVLLFFSLFSNFYKEAYGRKTKISIPGPLANDKLHGPVIRNGKLKSG